MTTQPTILAFDTAAPHCAVAVLVGNKIVAQAAEPMPKGQAERLMMLCSNVLANAGLTFKDLTAIGVGIGPGNFTGIRISVSAARGLALGLGIPAIGVSGFDALLFGQSSPCMAAIDARRGQIYLQRFNGENSSPPEVVPYEILTACNDPIIGHNGQPAAYPVAEAIARITVRRHLTPQPRPAPLYLRPADAAPARDAPPVILP